VAHRREGPLRGRRRVDGDRSHIIHHATLDLLRCFGASGPWKIVGQNFAPAGGKMRLRDRGVEIGEVI
jgi:hypothetical protein